MSEEIKEITAAQAIELAKSGGLADAGDDVKDIVIITDQAQNIAFLQWVMSDEGRKWREQAEEAAGE